MLILSTYIYMGFIAAGIPRRSSEGHRRKSGQSLQYVNPPWPALIWVVGSSISRSGHKTIYSLCEDLIGNVPGAVRRGFDPVARFPPFESIIFW